MKFSHKKIGKKDSRPLGKSKAMLDQRKSSKPSQLSTCWHCMVSLVKKINFKAIATVLRLSKAFVATLIAQSIGLSGHQLLMLNNLIVELIAYCASALENIRFAHGAGAFSIIVSEGMVKKRSFITGVNQSFLAITNAVICAAKEQNKTINVRNISINGEEKVFVASDVELETKIQGISIHVSGKPEKRRCVALDSEDVFRVVEWHVTSPHFNNLSDFMDFINNLNAFEVDKGVVIGGHTQSKNVFWVFEKCHQNNINYENELHKYLSHAMRPYGEDNFTFFEKRSGNYDPRSDLSPVTRLQGDCKHTFRFGTHDIDVEFSRRMHKDCWKITTGASMDIVTRFLQSLEPQAPLRCERWINMLRWQKSTKNVVKDREDDEDDEKSDKKRVDTKEQWCWEEFTFDLGKEIDQYFLTKRVEEVVIDALDASLKYERQRALLGVGLSANYLLEGEPGTGKTTLAYYFARVLHERHDRSVSVVHLGAEVFRSAEAFASATTDLARNKDMADTTVVLIDEADKLPFFKAPQQSKASALDLATFLTWLNTGSVVDKKSRFVFAMVNDRTVLERVNQQTSGALFRDGRFGTRVHVGGCDAKQFGEICNFVFPDDTLNAQNDDAFCEIVEMCEAHKNEIMSPLTVQRVQSLILQSNFNFQKFLALVQQEVSGFAH